MKMLTVSFAVAALAAAASAATVSVTNTFTVSEASRAVDTLRLSDQASITAASAKLEGYPVELGNPIFWLDASDTNNWTFTVASDSTRRVTRIPSKIGTRALIFIDNGVVDYAPTLLAGDAELCGGNTLDFGGWNSRQGLYFDDNGYGSNVLNNIGAVATLYGSQNGGGWILSGGYGDNGTGHIAQGYLFHRGHYTRYADGDAESARTAISCAMIKSPAHAGACYGEAWQDGIPSIPTLVGLSGAYQSIVWSFKSVAPNVSGIGFNDGRGGRTGGQRISEMMFFDRTLTREECAKLNAYLSRKWFNRDVLAFNGYNEVATVSETPYTDSYNSNESKVRVNMVADIPSGETLAVGELVGGRRTGTFVKTGAGTLCLASAKGYAGQIKLNGGTVEIKRGGKLPAALPAEPVLHLDATAASSLTAVEENGTNFVTRWNSLNDEIYLGSKIFGYARNAASRPRLVEAGGPNNLAYVDFGAMSVQNGAGCYLKLTNAIKNVATVFWVVGAQNGGGSVLEANAFKRHGNGGYGNSYADSLFESTGKAIKSLTGGNANVSNAVLRIDGVRVPFNTGYPSPNWHIIAVRMPGSEDVSGIGCTDSGFYGGMRLGELVVYDHPLSVEETAAAEQYLSRKWFGKDTPQYAAAETLDLQRLSVDGAGGVKTSSDAAVGELSGSGKIVKTGEGDLIVRKNSVFSGGIDLKEGRFVTREIEVAAADGAAENPVLHLDASRADSFNFVERGGTNFVASWHDIRQGRYEAISAVRWDSGAERPLPWLRGDDPANGNPVVDFGLNCSCRALKLTRPINTVRSAYIVIGTQDGSGGFLLGSDSTYGANYDFHRGGDMLNSYAPSLPLTSDNARTVRAGEFYTNGVKAAYTSGLNGSYELVEMYTPMPAHVSALACDRYGGAVNPTATNNETIYRTGGQRLGEVILYDRVLSERERVATRNYLMKKWIAGYVEQPLPEETAEVRVANINAADGTEIVADRPLSMNKLSGSGTVTLSGALDVRDIGSVTGTVAVASGSLAIKSLPAVEEPGLVMDGLVFWADATWGVALNASGTVQAWTNRTENTAMVCAYTTKNTVTYEQNALNGLPVLDLGIFGSGGAEMRFRDSSGANKHLSGIRSVFWVIGTMNNGGYLLGGGTNYTNAAQHYNFHRGHETDVMVTPTTILHPSNSDPVLRNTSVWNLNGVAINPTASYFSGDYDLVSCVVTNGYTDAEGFAFDGRGDYGSRCGGQKLAEVLIYDRPLTAEETLKVRAYLDQKWDLSVYSGGNRDATTLNIAAGATVDMGGIVQNFAKVVGGGSVRNGTLSVGELSPGTAEGDVATLSADSDFAFADGGTWVIDLAADGTDRVNVSGAVTFGANLRVVLRGCDALADMFSNGYRQTVLTSSSLVNPAALSTVTFDGLPNGVTASLAPDGKNVTLRISRGGTIFILR